MLFINHQISPALSNIVENMHIIEENNHTTVRALPVPRLIFAFNYKDVPHEKSQKGYTTTKRNSIDGYNNIPIDYIIDKPIGTLFVTFKPWAKSILKELNGDFNITDKIDLNDIYSGTKNIEEMLINEPSYDKKFNIIENFLLSIIDKKTANIYAKEAVNHIFLSNGTIKLDELSHKLGYSQKQVERIFTTHIGFTPKKFSKIVQFQNSLSLLKSNDFPFIEIAQNAGYFDQSHFINSFKKFTNYTPEQFLESQPSNNFNISSKNLDLNLHNHYM